MAHVAACGYPVPKGYEINGPDMVLERLTGPTMLDVLARRPWRVGSLSRTSGGFHDRLHTVPAPEWLPRRFATAGDDRVLHLPGGPSARPTGPGGGRPHALGHTVVPHARGMADRLYLRVGVP
ncbi:hypothetical protein [Streptomyces sp. P9-A2]|uniref:hypothetical protein n=1 Tax=Streptomyces sp. P9-A2 TaxID=3072284 RepID=UPI002FCB6677